GPGFSLSARGPTITFQRGTTASVSVAIWEDGQQSPTASRSMQTTPLCATQRLACQPCERGASQQNVDASFMSCLLMQVLYLGALRRNAAKNASAARWIRGSRGKPA